MHWDTAGRNWLFFGDQHRSENFYYRGEFEEMAADGFLSRLDLAFSRDQADRVYVQHKMLDRGAEVWRWLDDGAHFYVCGDASRMAKDVDAALTAILRTHGRMSEDAARDYKRELGRPRSGTYATFTDSVELDHGARSFQTILASSSRSATPSLMQAR